MNDEPTLSRETLLVRRSDLSLQLGSDGLVISCDGREVETGAHGLAILDAFSAPRTISEVVAKLAVAGAHDFAALTRTILQLKTAQVLTAPANRLSEGLGWDSSSIHARMLRDLSRTHSFLRALAEVVQPDDIVVDIGTGTGVLAIAAAKAGAKKVYAIEASGIAGAASAMFERNGVADRITLVRGWSTRVTLPEKATVMVSETVGNDALGEGIVETVLDARRRLLEPGARLMPERIRVWAIPCSLPDRIREDHLFTRDNVARWATEYGMSFEPLAEATRSPFALILAPQEVRGWRKLAPPVLIADLPLGEMEPLFELSATFRATEAGPFEAALLYFDLGLSPSVTYGTHPDEVSDQHSWSYMVWLNDKPREMAAGDSASLQYRYKFGAGKVRFL